ncbi:hypothetical protein VQ03_11025 [Methylobacterium tarhaniae]|uniref:DUF3572 domain-containing protein n=1 Tax=Methylobacterium tarhaniae TaxID=1187852 RepID=A0A0J6T957_9HYPH|nr:DUF3572 family protein [Methylobacterium tarhaniae]KMO42434.1 hypothetical protein VQ03_11025 [Methylobacterium tarhaniae]
MLSASAAEALGARVFAYVTGEPGRLLRFMESSGLSPDALRQAANSPDLVAGLLDHVVADEELLLACAAALEVPPERITQAWRRLGPQDVGGDPGEFGA